MRRGLPLTHAGGRAVVDQQTCEEAMSRQTIVLTEPEWDEFNRLRPIPGEAFDFWQKVSLARRLDYKTLLPQHETMSALPLGHTEHWCWPSTLKCKRSFRDLSAASTAVE